MLDGIEFFECECGSTEHTIQFVLNLEEKEIYAAVFLKRDRSFWTRLWLAFNYVVAIRPSPRYGHFGNWILRRPDAVRLRGLLNELDKKQFGNG